MWTIVCVAGVVAVALLAALNLQSVGISEQRRRLGAMLQLWPIDSSFTLTGNTHTTTTVDGLSSIAGLQPGMAISGAGIPAGTTIVAVTSAGGGSLTLSAAATATATGVTLTVQWLTSNAKVHLFAAPFAGGLDPAPTDFTEATFDTYTAQTITTFFGPYSNSDGTAEVDFGDIGWVLTVTPTVGNTIYGYWIDYEVPAGGATRLVACWETFATPVNMSAAGSGLVFSIPMKLPLPGSATIV